jgi:hypothetical protein
MNGSKKRYAGLEGCTDYKKAAQIIKDGGYATSPDYVQKLCRLIETYGLTKYDPTPTPQKVPPTKLPYMVRTKAGMKIYAAPNGKAVKACPVGIYTIMEERNGYGRLKSGAGWIKLADVQKM